MTLSHFKKRIIVRYHPSDPIHACLNGAKEGKVFLPDFLQSCKRIVCTSSNVNYEAMLYNRPVYDLGVSQYQTFVNSSLDGLPDHITDDTFINFIAFGYLVPFEMMKNVEYLRWRLLHPKEKEIYRYHLDYYLNCLGLPENILTQPAGTRLNMILERRKRPEQELQKEEIWMETTELTRMCIREECTKKQLEELRKTSCALQETMSIREESTKKQLEEMRETNCALQNRLQEIYNSRSWRLTQALRKIKNFILPKKKQSDTFSHLDFVVNRNEFLRQWQEFKIFATVHYPETEIISVNPVLLKGLFQDEYTDEYLEAVQSGRFKSPDLEEI